MTVRGWIALVAVVVGGVVGSHSSSAVAHDHAVPSAFLAVHEGGIQSRDAFRFRWMDGRNACRMRRYSSNAGFPEAIQTSESSSRLVFRHPDRPDELDLAAWALAAPDGQPLGPAYQLTYSLAPVRRNGETVAWRATIENPVIGHLFIEARGWWSDIEGCDRPQVAYWTFHLEVAP